MFKKGYMWYLEVAIVALVTIYIVKNYIPSVATQVGI